MTSNTKKLTTVAMLCAIAYVAVAVCRIPVVMFLKYEPKDVIITIGGFIFGPLTAFAMSAVVSLVEMFTLSAEGFIGLVMNVLSTATFACAAAYIYKKKHTLNGALIGLITGSILMTALMLLWNYLITPIYLGYPREAVAKMLVPVFLPFNLIKCGLNTAITLLVYKPLVTILRKSKLLDLSSGSSDGNKKIGLLLIALLLLATCVFFVLVLRGIL